MTNKNTNFILRISEQDKEKIKQVAEAKSMSMSEWVLYTVRKELEKMTTYTIRRNDSVETKVCDDVFYDLDEAIATIEQFEKEDIENGEYEENFYIVMDSDREIVYGR